VLPVLLADLPAEHRATQLVLLDEVVEATITGGVTVWQAVVDQAAARGPVGNLVTRAELQRAQRRARLEAFLECRAGRRFRILPVFAIVAGAGREVGMTVWSLP
jgi:hypothetical protein